jgi:hypothetical protein
MIVICMILFWDENENSGFEKAVSHMKQKNFSLDDIVGFIQMHWDRL